jgi:hypothetical protein
MLFPLQDIKRGHAADDVMHSRPRRARLTATQAELIFADADHFSDLRADAIQPTHLGSWQREAIGGEVLGAVSDHQDLQGPSQLAVCSLIWVTPIGPERLTIEAAILLEATHEIPPIVPDALQQCFRRIPGIKEDICRATVQAVAGIAEQLQSQLVSRGAAFAPESNAQGNPEGPICPDEQV